MFFLRKIISLKTVHGINKPDFYEIALDSYFNKSKM